MSKAAFVLWRDNLDLHLEGCNEFGIDASEMLKRVRLHTRIVDCPAMLEFHQDIKHAGNMAGNPRMLTCWNTGAAHRELYKFLHTKLTAKAKAPSVLTCHRHGVRAL